MQMSDEKLELIKMLSQYDKEEMQQILIIMTYWDEMVEKGIISIDDINQVADLSEEKQNNIKEYVSKKIQSQIERNNNGTKSEETEKS